MKYSSDRVSLLKATSSLLRTTRLDRVSALAGVGGVIAYLTSPRDRRDTVRRHQRMALGSSATKWQIERSVVAAFSNYARYWVSLLSTPYLKSLEIALNTRVVNRGTLDLVLEEGSGALVVSPHIGNWDFGAAWFATLGGRVLAVTEELKDESLKEWFWKDRKDMGIDPIYPGAKATTQILKALEDNYVVALVSDRDLFGNGLEVEFFGQRIKIPTGPAVLSIRSKTPIVPCAIFMSPKREYNIVFYEPIYPQTVVGENLRERVHLLTQIVADAMRLMIETAPSQWLAFVSLNGEEEGFSQ